MRHIIVDLESPGCDLRAFSGHKMGAGTDIGALCGAMDAMESPEALSSAEGLRVLAKPAKRAGPASCCIDGVHPLGLCTTVDAHGIAPRSGLNCAQTVLDWYGLTSLSRLSPAFCNKIGEIDHAVDQVRKVSAMPRLAR